jgi:hypothetical protein
MISTVPSVSSVHVELDGRLPSTAGRTDVTTKFSTTFLYSILDGDDDSLIQVPFQGKEKCHAQSMMSKEANEMQKKTIIHKCKKDNHCCSQ